MPHEYREGLTATIALAWLGYSIYLANRVPYTLNWLAVVLGTAFLTVSAVLEFAQTVTGISDVVEQIKLIGYLVGTILFCGGMASWATYTVRLAKKLEESNRLDHLTGLLNRRALQEVLAREIESSKRYGHKFSLIFFDLDNFKYINDTEGHAAGDAFLKELGEIIMRKIRSSDFAARFGGDEFCIILPQTDRNEAEAFISRLEAEVEVLAQAWCAPVGASFGSASYPYDGEDPDALLRTADRDMYQEKMSEKTSGFGRAKLHA